jgi:hypothetical protein
MHANVPQATCTMGQRVTKLEQLAWHQHALHPLMLLICPARQAGENVDVPASSK